MSDVCVSLIDMIFLNADNSVSVMLLASPHSRNSVVTSTKGFKYCFSTAFIGLWLIVF